MKASRTVLEMEIYIERLDRCVQQFKLCAQLCTDQRRRVISILKVTNLQVLDRRVKRSLWHRRKDGSRNFRFGTSKWTKDYIGTVILPPSFTAEKFGRSYGITGTLYKKRKEHLLKHRPGGMEDRNDWC